MKESWKILFNYIIYLLFFSLVLNEVACSGGGTTGTGGSSLLRATIVSENKQPLSNVTATLLNDNQMSTSDENGDFSLSIPRSGGTVSLQFSGNGLDEASISLELPESKDSVVVVFEGDTEENTVTPTEIKVEDKPKKPSDKPSSNPSVAISPSPIETLSSPTPSSSSPYPSGSESISPSMESASPAESAIASASPTSSPSASESPKN